MQKQTQPRETVLVVEGQDQMRRALVRVLRRFGYQVLAASGALGARRLAGAHGKKINLLLTDFSRRGVDGLNLARWFQIRFPKANILITTGFLWELLCDVNEWERFGVLVRPFSDLELGRTVKRLTSME